MFTTPAINSVLGILTVLGQLIILALFGSLVFKQTSNKFFRFFGENAFFISFLAVLGATIGSLFYSSIAGYEPCNLCWIQRIFMYPQVIIFGIALWKKDYTISSLNALILSILGAIIALYNHLIQMGITTGLCGASLVSCAKRYVMEFGYITMPMMSLTIFLLIIMLMVVNKRLKQS
ncbi:MAG: disulfide bond formation protein B [Patescibacteria group bacterium]